MAIPEGVTVRQPGEPVLRKPNQLDAAAACDRLADAKAIIAGALGLDPNSKVAQVTLADPDRWARLSPTTRLSQIGDWLRAEAFECMDFVSVPDILTKGD